jgi:crotonobetainyl-CoA:carnitine CoA-transferase CaiB-like acyl-CoA transferase
MNGVKTQVPIMPIEMDGRRFATRLDLPKIGEHTREMLADLGYAPQEIERLITSGVARTD